MNKQTRGVWYAILAAAFYALNAPLSKLLLGHVPPTMMAAFLYLGAAKTSAYYAIAPFIGVAMSLVIFRELPHWSFFGALAIMIVATVLVTRDGFDAERS